jgi:hypothetical protein
MRKLLLAATLVAMGGAVAMAQGGPNPSGMDSPGNKVTKQQQHMKSSPVKMKRKHKMKPASMKGNAPGPETGTAKDKASAPSR